MYVFVQIILLFEDKHGRRPSADDTAAVAELTKASLQDHGMPSDYISKQDVCTICAQVQATQAHYHVPTYVT